MSLEINVRQVARILLPDGKWHAVESGSFDTDAYEFVEAEGEEWRLLFGGGQSPLVTSTGVTWKDHGKRAFAPLTSILAVEYAVSRTTTSKAKTTGAPEAMPPAPSARG